MHVPVAVLHASSAGQSLAVSQPHLPEARHAPPPEELAEHVVQAAPVVPQAEGELPATHVPPLQQPP